MALLSTGDSSNILRHRHISKNKEGCRGISPMQDCHLPYSQWCEPSDGETAGGSFAVWQRTAAGWTCSPCRVNMKWQQEDLKPTNSFPAGHYCRSCFNKQHSEFSALRPSKTRTEDSHLIPGQFGLFIYLKPGLPTFRQALQQIKDLPCPRFCSVHLTSVCMAFFLNKCPLASN